MKGCLSSLWTKRKMRLGYMMGTLDDQLAKLRLISSYPLAPSVFSASQKNFNEGPTLIGTVPSEVSPKKIGPAVPPKPNKKGSQLPEVPQSMVVRQTCEPLYCKRLQNDSIVKDAATKKIAKPGGSNVPSLHRKQPSYLAQHIYSNNKVTLDNPAILDQQLEALEHHKKQLQKKGLLQNKTPLPKLSSASFLSGCDVGNITRNTSPNPYVYPNAKTPIQSIRKANDVSNVYSNINNKEQDHFTTGENIPTGNFVYSNLEYTNNDDDLPPPPSLGVASNISISESSEYTNQCGAIDDDIPPPPSPVSSSYSELRRATDIYQKLPSYPASSSVYNTNNHTKNKVANNQQKAIKLDSQSTDLSGCMPNERQQTYINMNYNNDYNSYGSPLSQRSFSQSYSDYYGYGSSSQGSSTYESIYEPINPRPPSQLSSRSNYMPYTSYANSSQISEGEVIAPDGGGASTNLNVVAPLDVGSGAGNKKQHNHKEAEVEALTDLLVHSMDVGNDVDSFGICVACNERVIGENSGCTAMDQVYHIACFTCCQCQINLQGKPFYALDGKPYCEVDYLNTLEKCSVCMKPILERILRATGKPYHPQCFTCVVCANSLDGIPFTVDATNQNYCIADFHKKFAPRCCVCKMPIMPENGQEETVRVVALDRSFHFECYKCEDCGLLLSSEAEGRGCYPLDDHVLCKSCNAKRVQMLTSRMTTEL